MEQRVTTEVIIFLMLSSLAACVTPPAPQVRFDRPKASAQDFEVDRVMCIQHSLRKKSGADTNDYDGSIAKNALPSRTEYTKCMIERDWHMVTEGGFLPQSPTAMTE